jgi:hypothetical protein
MPNFKDVLFNYSKISAMALDLNENQYLWLAYTLKSGTCRLQKVSVHNVTQVYFTIELPVTSINAMKVLGEYLFIAITDNTYAAYILNVTNPLSSQVAVTKSSLSLDESPIDVQISSTNAYFLTPGSQSGNHAQLASYNNLATYEETIDLTFSGLLVANAVSFTIDLSDNMWVITNSNPTELYRVWFQSGGWEIELTTLT